MKRTTLLGILLLLLVITSCNKENIELIRLHHVENNSIDMIYPNTNGHSISIVGGDGRYSVSCDNVSVLEVELVQEKKMILLKPQSIGNAIVTITDESENLYVLHVTVHYSELKLMIDKQDVIVMGDKLSEEQKAEIRQKAILTLPVNVNGGFKFIYNNDKELNKGQVFIYKDNYGGEAIESVFEFKRVEREVDGAIKKYNVYAITINGKQREFIVDIYFASKSKGDMIPPMALKEDITEQFKTEYRDVEFVYTQQRVKSGVKPT